MYRTLARARKQAASKVTRRAALLGVVYRERYPSHSSRAGPVVGLGTEQELGMPAELQILGMASCAEYLPRSCYLLHVHT